MSYDIDMNVSETEWYLDKEDNIIAIFKMPSTIGGNLSKSTNFDSAFFSFIKDTSELRVTLHGQGEGYVQIGQKPSENPSNEEKPKSIFRDPIFIFSFTLNIILLLTVITLRQRRMRSHKYL